MYLNRLTSMLRVASVSSKTIPQFRHLHYQPSASRSRIGIKEPQKLDAFYVYRYIPGEIAEVFGEAKYQTTDPYEISVFYDWENWEPKEYNEHWGIAPIWVYVVFGFIHFWVFLSMLFIKIDAESKGKPAFGNPDISGGLGYYTHNYSLIV